MNFKKFSNKYNVKMLKGQDAPAVLEISQGNPLFYKYHKTVPSIESIVEDMNSLPPDKGYEDKYYVGFFNNEELIAVMDLITGFPEKRDVYIGFFMLKNTYQNKGQGTLIVEEVFSFLKSQGYKYIKLCIDKDNPQSRHFWMKNGFVCSLVYEQEKNSEFELLEKKVDSVSRVILTNMCMLESEGNVLVQEKILDDGSTGIIFPGGHIDSGESITDSVIREMKEETGLTVKFPVLCGIKDWFEEDGARYIVFLFKSTEYEGEPVSSVEGRVFWTPKEKLSELNLIWHMPAMIKIFDSEKYSELFLDADWNENLN